ncbi:hypothetical protein D3C78_1169310 [compost metagenome]
MYKYRELGDLENNGYVTSTIIPQEGKPSKKQYALTDSGLQELVNWINEYYFKESMKVRTFRANIEWSTETYLHTRVINLSCIRRIRRIGVARLGPCGIFLYFLFLTPANTGTTSPSMRWS